MRASHRHLLTSRSRPRIDRVAAVRARIAVCFAVVALGGCMRGPNPLPPPSVPPSDELTRRIEAYLALHRRVAATLPPRHQTDDAAALVERRKALSVGIRAARPDARPGA